MPHPPIAFLAPGGGELIVVMLALLLLFGPKDAPRILRNLQNLLHKLKRTAADFQRTLMSELPVEPTAQTKDTSVYDAEKKSAGGNIQPAPNPPPPNPPAP
jgi:Sec-independent protein translocase protein TatA